MQNRPRRFCLEIFAGTARVSQALQNQGISAFPVDIDLFPSHNVLDPFVCHNILNWIQSGRILLVWLGMPCTTFSRARRFDGIGPPPVRTSEYIWGLDKLRKNDAKKLADGNKLFAFTMKVLALCEKTSTPYILENPLSSMAWEMPPLVSFSAKFSPSIADLDFCAWWAFLFHPVGFADAQTYVKSHSNFQHLGGVSGQKRCEAFGSHIYIYIHTYDLKHIFDPTKSTQVISSVTFLIP